MKAALSNLASYIADKLVPPDTDPTLQDSRIGFRDAVDQARREWLAAKAYFDTVSDPYLVDHAIYLVEASEKKYMYLLRRAQDQGSDPELPAT